MAARPEISPLTVLCIRNYQLMLTSAYVLTLPLFLHPLPPEQMHTAELPPETCSLYPRGGASSKCDCDWSLQTFSCLLLVRRRKVSYLLRKPNSFRYTLVRSDECLCSGYTAFLEISISVGDHHKGTHFKSSDTRQHFLTKTRIYIPSSVLKKCVHIPSGNVQWCIL